MKLQKLVYYSQAWSLVWDDRLIFEERVEAWANGPVSPDLYSKHRGLFKIQPGQIEGASENLDPVAIETINAVLEFYGDRSANWLSELTHAEAPWLDARNGLPAGAKSDAEISHASMAEYYGSL